MLVQDWLRQNNGDFVRLEKQLGISTTFHPKDNRVILNYSQIDSPKSNPVVRECRALTLDKNNFQLIARGFPRFFNYGEYPENDKAFRWENSIMQEKLDGSLITCFYWNNDWHIQTRASFGYGEINGITWYKLFELALPLWKTKLESFRHGRLTYVFELCSRYNKVVRDYPNPVVSLLTMYDDDWELQPETVDVYADKLGLNRPKLYQASCFEEVQNIIESISENDKTFEGFVLRDEHGIRIKFKAKSYILLHRLVNNGNGFLPKNLVPLILMGEADELRAYWKEQEDKIDDIEDILADIYQQLDNNWYTFGDEVSQKKFALAIANCPANSILFQARKREADWKKIFRESSDLLVKIVENKLK